jgi:hypothetical protein
LQGLPKFTQIGIFGRKIYHLATLPRSSSEINKLFPLRQFTEF